MVRARRPHVVAAGAIAASGLLALALRLPFVATGIGPDEGGYAYVAQQWARGARLYQSAWIDRPQGLMVVYRLLLDLGSPTWSIRLGAVLFGVGVTLLLGAAGWLLKGPAAGVAAAGIYAVVGVAPRLEGFTFNAELAAALPTAAAVVAALLWRRSRRGAWLLVAGAAGGAALLMKQSGFDGLVIAAVIAATADGWRARGRSLALLAAGAAVPLGASVVHGLTVGWHNYWFAVVDYKLGAASAGEATLHDRADYFHRTFPSALADLHGVVLIAALGALLALRRRTEAAIPLVWFLVALVGFNVGGLYWRHYYVQLLAPLALLAAVAIANVRRLELRAVLAAIAVVPVAVYLVQLATMSHAQRVRTITYYRSYEADRRIAAAIRARSSPDAPIYVLSARADVYLLAHRRTSYRYLWGHEIHEIKGAVDELRSLLTRPTGPDWVVAYSNPLHVDHSGLLMRDLVAHYCFDSRVLGSEAIIFRRAQAPRARRRCASSARARALEAAWKRAWAAESGQKGARGRGLY